jgi:hypothetical protein
MEGVFYCGRALEAEVRGLTTESTEGTEKGFWGREKGEGRRGKGEI